MTWNYRILRHTYTHDGEEEEYFMIHEVRYNEDGTPYACTKDRAGVGGETLQEVIDVLVMIFSDALRFRDDILDYDDFGEGGKYHRPKPTHDEIVAGLESGEYVEFSDESEINDEVETNKGE